MLRRLILGLSLLAATAALAAPADPPTPARQLRPGLWLVEGVGHNGDKMLTSSCGLAALFDQPGCPMAKASP